jgi:MSHA biogenesis protein MshK
VFKLSYASVLCFLCLSLCVAAQTPVVDPTKPLGFVGGTTGSALGGIQETIKVTSILISSDRKVAIINGQPLHENQTLKGAGAAHLGVLVKKIDADAVTLQQNGKVWRVALNSTVIRK